MAFLAYVHVTLFLALSLSPGNSVVSSFGFFNIGRQLVELLCFSGDLPLTDIFLIMCIYWRIN